MCVCSDTSKTADDLIPLGGTASSLAGGSSAKPKPSKAGRGATDFAIITTADDAASVHSGGSAGVGAGGGGAGAGGGAGGSQRSGRSQAVVGVNGGSEYSFYQGQHAADGADTGRNSMISIGTGVSVPHPLHASHLSICSTLWSNVWVATVCCVVCCVGGCDRRLCLAARF
jgi:hypothetical protein